MKLVKFLYQKQAAWGILEGDKVEVLREPPFKYLKRAGKKLAFDKVALLPPAMASKIVLVGLNYRDHAEELNMPLPKEPVIFLKPLTALIAHEEKIFYPQGVKRLDYEAELALVIKKQAKNIKEKEVEAHILGYTCLNDVTARDIQKKDGQWTRAKSYDTFCPLGPWLETEVDPERSRISSYLNGALCQNSNTGNLIFSIPRLVSFISKVMTLYPGDIISTGTPPGVNKMKLYDIIEIEIEKIGRLRNQVVP